MQEYKQKEPVEVLHTYLSYSGEYVNFYIKIFGKVMLQKKK